MNYETVDILLVEDNAEDAELIIRELKRHHFANNLVHVRDGEDALDFIFKTGKLSGLEEISFMPKVILLDINMPKMNGMQVLEKLKSDERTKKVPVVILTSSKEDPDIRQCTALGANSYIVKPVNFERFAEAIKNLGFYWMLLNQHPNI